MPKRDYEENRIVFKKLSEKSLKKISSRIKEKNTAKRLKRLEEKAKAEEEKLLKKENKNKKSKDEVKSESKPKKKIKLKPDKDLLEDNRLPDKYAPLFDKKKLSGIPLEEVDEYYKSEYVNY